MTFLDKYLDRKALAKALGSCERTVARMENEPDGLPFTIIAGRKYYRIEAVEQWLASREQRPNPRRTRAAEAPAPVLAKPNKIPAPPPLLASLRKPEPVSL